MRLLVLVLLILGSTALVQAQPVQPDHDGPYVYWHDSSRATVFYNCLGELRQETFEDFDTLAFRRLCDGGGPLHTIHERQHALEPNSYDGVVRIMVVSDIHGEYEALIEFLKTTGLVDDSLAWTWGEGHLVVDGDIFDRGDAVTETLWLVYRLEQEAAAVGGRVHTLLGNHEKMVLRGDNRYINEKYLDGIARKSRIKHEDLFGPDMALGRWLRSKPTAMRINDVLFVHGGISPQLRDKNWSIEQINLRMREVMDYSSGRVAFDEEAKLLLGSYGPLWYRGFLTEIEGRYAQLTGEEVAACLEPFGVSCAVVGHTDMGEVASYHDGLVYGVDVDVPELGGFQGLLIEAGRYYKVNVNGEKTELN